MRIMIFANLLVGDVGAFDMPLRFWLIGRRTSWRRLPSRWKMPGRTLHGRRASREGRAQAELAASYHVEPVTQGRALVQVEGDAHAITSNLLSVRFSISPEGGARDNSFDVHFIDEKGRALCERQMVEVVNGCVVPEVVRFCLATRSDSGSVFDLVVHEQDRDQAVLAARVPYKADISFNTEDFGF